MRLADRAARLPTTPSPPPGRRLDASGRLQRLTLAPDLLSPASDRLHEDPPSRNKDSASHEVLTGVGQWVPLTAALDGAVPDEVDLRRSGPGGRLSEAVHRWLPVSSLDAGVRGVAALAALALLAALVAVGVAWRAAPRPAALPAERPLVQVPSSPIGSGSSSSAVSAGTPRASGSATVRVSAAPEVVVDVVGKVRHPGLVRLPAGSRVDDALAAAGGAQPGTDLTAVPLARRLADGEQVAVGVTVPGASSSLTAAGSPTAAASPGPAATPAEPVDLNAATVEQLDALPGVGPVLAQRIVAWRDAHGGFSSVDQLRQVSGLGGRKGQALVALVRV